MSAVVTSGSATRAGAHSERRFVVGDSLAIVWRNLLNIRRNPELLVFATIQPVIFVVLFRYVFGGAIQGSLPAGQTYINYLMPGVFVQTIVFGSLTTGVSIASAATPPKHVKLLTCKAPLVATRVKETLKGKTVHVWKCEPAQHASLKVKKPAPAPKKST